MTRGDRVIYGGEKLISYHILPENDLLYLPPSQLSLPVPYDAPLEGINFKILLFVETVSVILVASPSVKKIFSLKLNSAEN